MNAVTQLESSAIDALFERYDLGHIDSFQLAANGVENSNYFVELKLKDGRARQVVLTLLEQPSYAGPQPFIDLLDSGFGAGLPVPRLYRNRDNQAFEQCSGKPAIVCSRLLGQHVLNPTHTQISAIGRFIARFHQATQPLHTALPSYPRDLAWLKDGEKIIDGRTAYAELRLIRDGIGATASLLRRQDVQRLPRSVIHGDLFRDNALFNSSGLSGVLDFHHAATGYCIYDLAVIANDWCTDGTGRIDPDRALTLLQSYHRVRALESAEIWWFSVFSIYAAVAFYLSRARARAAGTGRVKDPAEFARVLEQHLRAPLSVDERMVFLG